MAGAFAWAFSNFMPVDAFGKSIKAGDRVRDAFANDEGTVTKVSGGRVSVRWDSDGTVTTKGAAYIQRNVTKEESTMPSKTEQHPDAIVRGVIEASNFALSAEEARELIAAAVAAYNRGGKTGVFRQVKIAAERTGLEPEDYDDAASWLQQNVGSFNLARFGRESVQHEQHTTGSDIRKFRDRYNESLSRREGSSINPTSGMGLKQEQGLPAGTRVWVKQTASGIKHLYPAANWITNAQQVTLLEYAPNEGTLDVFDVRLDDGTEKSIYDFNIEKVVGESLKHEQMGPPIVGQRVRDSFTGQVGSIEEIPPNYLNAGVVVRWDDGTTSQEVWGADIIPWRGWVQGESLKHEQEQAFRKVKTITSHTGKFLWLHEVGDPIGWISRPEDIPSPYAYSPFWPVYRYRGEPVVIAEISHKKYVIYAVPPEAVGVGPQPY